MARGSCCAALVAARPSLYACRALLTCSCCHLCCGAGKALIRQLESEGIDWNSVAGIWAKERGCRPEDVAPGILAAARLGGWGERQEAVQAGVVTEKFEKWLCTAPVLLSSWSRPRHVSFVLQLQESETNGGMDHLHPGACSSQEGVSEEEDADLDDDEAEELDQENEKEEDPHEQEGASRSVQGSAAQAPTPNSPYSIFHSNPRSPHHPSTPGMELALAPSLPHAIGSGMLGCLDMSPAGHDMGVMHLFYPYPAMPVGSASCLPLGLSLHTSGSPHCSPPHATLNGDFDGDDKSRVTLHEHAPFSLADAGTGSVYTSLFNGSSTASTSAVLQGSLTSPFHSSAPGVGEPLEDMNQDIWKDSLWQIERL